MALTSFVVSAYPNADSYKVSEEDVINATTPGRFFAFRNSSRGFLSSNSYSSKACYG